MPGGRWGWLALLLAFLIAILVSLGFASGYLPIMRFDAEGWRRGGGEQTLTPVRLQMIEWLTRSGQLDGLTRREVLALLGPADDTPYFRDWDLVYRLGPERDLLFRIDSEWLVIRFGRDGRVSDYRVVSD